MEVKQLKEVYDYLQTISDNSKLCNLVIIQDPVKIRILELESITDENVAPIIKRIEVSNDHEVILSVPYETCKVTESIDFIILTTISSNDDHVYKNYIFESAIIVPKDKEETTVNI